MVTHQLQVKRRTGKVRRPETDDLPLCHATNQRVGRDSKWEGRSERAMGKGDGGLDLDVCSGAPEVLLTPLQRIRHKQTDTSGAKY